jgi:ADP-heptose:LPS heptosyltransferase
MIAAPARVLVLRALGLGDLLTAVPPLRALRDAYPAARLELACPGWLHELVHEWMLADAAIDVAPLAPLPDTTRRPDVAVNLHGRGPQSTRVLLEACPRRLVAFAHPEVPETRGLPQWRQHEHEVARWCRLLVETGMDADPDRLSLPVPQTRAAEDLAGATVVHPGASAPARRWPWRRWAAVARDERRQGRRVVLTGSGDERGRCLRIARAAGVPAGDVLAGRTSLRELAAAVGAAGLLVSADTGVAHLATAFGTPSVVLFGPIPPYEWGPPPSRPQHRALWSGLRGDPNGDVPHAGLLDLMPARVVREMELLRAALERRAPLVAA